MGLTKDAENVRKHGIRFDAASQFFDDPHAASSPHATQIGMSETTIFAERLPDGRIKMTRPDGSQEIVESEPAREMSDEEVRAAALADPDARPLTPEQLAKFRPVARVRMLRQALRLSEEEFAARYRIPLNTLRDWERHRSEPDAPAEAYLAVITQEPELVRKALDAAEARFARGV